MAEVIDLKKRKGQTKKARQEKNRRIAGAVAGVLSAGICPKRCTRCSQPVENPGVLPADAPFPFCGPCYDEYRAFKRREGGQAEPEAFWHTEVWVETWRAWLNFMRKNLEFRSSGAFIRLLEEYQE